MEAKDTVMNEGARRQFRIITKEPQQDCSYWNIEAMLLAQAESAFKAGIKEVVEWINQIVEEDMLYNWRYRSTMPSFRMAQRDWQAKLKEWGIEMK